MSPAVALLGLLAVVGADDDEWGDEDDAVVLEGNVRDDAEPAAESTLGLDGLDVTQAAPEAALEALPGLTLVRDGGPLAPSTVRFRGLGGARLRADVFGLALDDPATGALDASLWPLFGLARATTRSGPATGGLAGRLSLDDDAMTPALRARFGGGTLETARLDAFGRASTADGGSMGAGVTAATTRGDFAYAPLPGGDDDVRRENNDQRLASVLLRGARPTPFGRVRAVAFGSAREGGVPGFATAPTEALRAQRLFAGARAGVVSRGDVETAASADARVGQRSTWTATRAPEAVTSLAWNARAGMRGSLWGAQLTTSLRAGTEHVVEVAQAARARTDAGGRARLPLFGGALAVVGGLGAEALVPLDGDWKRAALIPRVDVGVDASLLSGLRGSLRLAHGGRAPTLDELWAPRGLVLGNPGLAPERGTEAEAAVVGELGDVMSVRATAFAGRLEDTILFVNRNAFEVLPLNTGPLWRAGVEGALRLTPHPWLLGELTGEALASVLDATGGALPVAPPFAARLHGRLGPAGGAQLGATMRARAGAPSTIFGTLPTDGYALVDVFGRVPLGAGVAATCALTNALDVRDARDANLLPLPGRQLFLAVELAL